MMDMSFFEKFNQTDLEKLVKDFKLPGEQGPLTPNNPNSLFNLKQKQFHLSQSVFGHDYQLFVPLSSLSSQFSSALVLSFLANVEEQIKGLI